MKKKVGRVSDMADKRKNRDFEGNGKRKSQMVKLEKTWSAGKSGKKGEKGAGRQSGKLEGTWAPGKSEKGAGRQSGKLEGTWVPGKSEKGAGRQSAKPETGMVRFDGKKNSLEDRKAVQKSGGKETGKVRKNSLCPVSHRCGGCQYLDMPYEEQLKKKQAQMQALLGRFCKVYPIKGMDNPFHYRNKVHAVFGHRKGEIISGVYEAGTHNLVPVESCMIEDEKADEIIGTIRGMLKSFKIKTFDEDTGYGLLRHVLIRRGFVTNEIMVVLVTASPVFPSKNNFVKALREKHPEITTIVQNINGRGTSMVLGDREQILYGKGYIEDVLCGCRFRISPRSFYQVNPVQTEYLYGKAIELAGLTGKELVLDAYCGIGTIGMIASKEASTVIGVELNSDAVKDAIQNAKMNGIRNIRFFCNDATKFMMQMAMAGDTVDVVLMDPPRSGSTEEFIRAVAAVKAKRVVYISCGPETLARDLEIFAKCGYRAQGAWPVDMFAFVDHTECIVKLERVN